MSYTEKREFMKFRADKGTRATKKKFSKILMKRYNRLADEKERIWQVSDTPKCKDLIAWKLTLN